MITKYIMQIKDEETNINPKVMGAIFSKSSGLEKIGYQQSKRKVLQITYRYIEGTMGE